MRIYMRIMAQNKARCGSPTNLYLSATMCAEGRRIAKERYDMSLSELVAALLKREMNLKKGLLNLRRTVGQGAG